uniref:Uncharacterized protein n=1 Tax=viral metagenome TaxID=1070528 RepID=A0A6C0ADC4_9ZZZZ
MYKLFFDKLHSNYYHKFVNISKTFYRKNYLKIFTKEYIMKLLNDEYDFTRKKLNKKFDKKLNSSHECIKLLLDSIKNEEIKI